MSSDAARAAAVAGASAEQRDPEQVNGAAIQDGSAVEAEGNRFQQAVAAWRNLDLTSLVSSLDKTAAELVDHQRDGVTQRKDLAQKTKDFRKLDDAGKLTEIKGLLKAYQGFIDLLTNQSKSVSSAFLSAYSPLSDAPDPYPLLEASIESLVTAEEVLPKLEAENGHLKTTVEKLTSQLDDTEKQLETERTARQSSQSGQDTRVKEVEASWSAVLKEKQDNWDSRERSLEEKVESQDRLLKELKANYEVTERLGMSEAESADTTSRNAARAELEIVNSELEKTNLRLSDVETRNEQLRIELAQSTTKSSDSGKSSQIEDEPAYLRLRSENSSLMRRLDASRFERSSAQEKLEGKIRGLEREIVGLGEDRDLLKRRTEKWGDYEEVKQELDMLKSIEFADADDGDTDDGDTDDEDTAMNGNADKSKAESLEKLLLARNKKLGNDLTLLRVSHQELQSQLETIQEDLSGANMELEKSRGLNSTLENDLLKAQQHASNQFDPSAMSVAGIYTSRYPKSSYASRRGGTSPTSSLISGMDGQQGSPRTLEALRSGEAVGGGSGILPMVTAQRDRFKKKITEMEGELSKTYQTVSSLRSEIASLQKDNLNLYEKTRYVSTYNRSQPLSSSSAYASNPNPSSIQISSDSPSGSSLDRYRSAYESNLSPFAAFRGRESARAFKRMTLPERAVYQFTRMVLATRTSRNLFAMYCLSLHLLVLIMLYWAGTGDIEQHASNLGKSAAAVGAGAALHDDSSHGQWQQEGFQGAR